jgi:hypothetical protein
MLLLSKLRDGLANHAATHPHDYDVVSRHTTLMSCSRWTLGYIDFFARYADYLHAYTSPTMLISLGMQSYATNVEYLGNVASF